MDIYSKEYGEMKVNKFLPTLDVCNYESVLCKDAGALDSLLSIETLLNWLVLKAGTVHYIGLVLRTQFWNMPLLGDCLHQQNQQH